MKKSPLATLDDLQQIFNDYAKINEGLWEDNRNRLDKIIAVLDAVSKNIQDLREENAASTLHFERNDETLNNHEKRLKSLESAKN